MTEGGLTELAKTKALQAVWGWTIVPLSSGLGTLEKSPLLLSLKLLIEINLLKRSKSKPNAQNILLNK